MFPNWWVFSLVILMISGVALSAVFWLLRYWIQGSRSEAWQRIAESLCFTYREKNAGVLKPYSHFDTFSQGTERASAFVGIRSKWLLALHLRLRPSRRRWRKQAAYHLLGPVRSACASALQHSTGNLAFSTSDKADGKDSRSPIYRAS